MDRSQIAKALERADQLLAAQKDQGGVSAAKSYYPDGLRGTSLENAPDAGQAFDASKGELAQEASIGDGSQQVGDAGTANDTRPSPEFAQGPDRDKHQADMAKDDQAAKLADAKALADAVKDRGPESGPEHERGYEPE